MLVVSDTVSSSSSVSLSVSYPMVNPPNTQIHCSQSLCRPPETQSLVVSRRRRPRGRIDVLNKIVADHLQFTSKHTICIHYRIQRTILDEKPRYTLWWHMLKPKLRPPEDSINQGRTILFHLLSPSYCVSHRNRVHILLGKEPEYNKMLDYERKSRSLLHRNWVWEFSYT